MGNYQQLCDCDEMHKQHTNNQPIIAKHGVWEQQAPQPFLACGAYMNEHMNRLRLAQGSSARCDSQPMLYTSTKGPSPARGQFDNLKNVETEVPSVEFGDLNKPCTVNPHFKLATVQCFGLPTFSELAKSEEKSAFSRIHSFGTQRYEQPRDSGEDDWEQAQFDLNSERKQPMSPVPEVKEGILTEVSSPLSMYSIEEKKFLQ